jgi:hypothetical protein
MRTYEHGLRMATDGSTVLRGAADMHVGMPSWRSSGMTRSCGRSSATE